MQVLRSVVCLLVLVLLQSCDTKAQNTTSQKIIVGAERPELYLNLLKNKRIALVVNQTSTAGNGHLVDYLLAEGIQIQKVFAPEHGFRGDASAGEDIKSQKDAKTGIELLSLYGNSRKPTKEQLSDVDLVIFDIQDVGVRFYTYISTMHYVMQACAEYNKPLLVLDRPNPNGHYTAGPVLDMKYQSFVGIAPIALVHGCTVGELATMFNKEGWLGENLFCNLTVIPCKNYTHQSTYILPVKPSPNLPNNQSIWLYPSICLFEATPVSVGRGTDMQFQVIGAPYKSMGKFTFTPVDKPGALNPPQEGKLCYGLDLRRVDGKNHRFSLDYLFRMKARFPDSAKFFTSESFFNKLIGNGWVLEDIKAGKTAEAIEAKWKPELEKYRKLRSNYLLYP